MTRFVILKFSHILHFSIKISTFKNFKDIWQYTINNNTFRRPFNQQRLTASFTNNTLRGSWKVHDKTNNQLPAQLKILLSYCKISAHVRSQSNKKIYIWNRAPASRRSTFATVAQCSADFKLYFDASRITPRQLVIELHELKWTCA